MGTQSHKRLHSTNNPPLQNTSGQHQVRSASSASSISAGGSLTNRLLSRLSISNLFAAAIPEGYDADDDNISVSKLSIFSNNAAPVNAPTPNAPLFTPVQLDDNGEPIIPLKSQYFECCCEFFKEPQILPSDSEQED
ncbi:unnamed protein product [Ambrosiozyma monospora]|uniref:Unnamed protein product n=1 Tax=Ambrosiozyma monospora TaxID=43982 RepID=A0ACB5UB28_AMBMO|nr:unnamed protein product [Ambrosiozyma monospora]